MMLTNDTTEVKGEVTGLARLDDTPNAPMPGERASKLLIVVLGAGLFFYLIATGEWSAVLSTVLGAVLPAMGGALR